VSRAFAVVNPAAGGGRTERAWRGLRDELTRSGLAIEWVASAAPGDATALAARCSLIAGAAIGNGLYGVDLKQVGDEYFVIEVNDNPTIAAGEEDQKAPGVYERELEDLLVELATTNRAIREREGKRP